MGFISTATTITLTAKLTNTGRKRLLKENNNILSHFMLGDSDANYQTSATLPTGKIPTDSGSQGVGGDESIVKSKLYVNNTSITKKAVKSGSNLIDTSTSNVGQSVVITSNLTYIILNKNNTSTDVTNLFKSLNLPILEKNKATFTATTSQNGGWLDTAFSGLATNQILLSVIDNSEYGELIDGKSIKSTLPIATGFTSGGTVTGITDYTFYSTFVNSGQFNKTQFDDTYKDNSVFTQGLFGAGANVSYMLSDNIQRPNNDVNNSWSTGYNSYKPYSIGNKKLLNTKTVATTGIVVDKLVGVAYLDKGMIIYTDPNIVNNVVTNFSGASASTNTVTNSLGLYYYTGITYNTIIDSNNTDLIQNIICEADRGEFYRSENETIDNNDTVRISEIAITDQAGIVLAYVKPDRQIEKLKNDLLIFDIQIVI
jgi:hypothetical protein